MDAASDQDILAALGGIIEMQRTIRSGLELCIKSGLVFLRVYYQELPESVARRLTEIRPLMVSAIPEATSPRGTAEVRQGIAASVASDAALAQAIRAANLYRRKSGRELLGPDGYPIQDGGVKV